MTLHERVIVSAYTGYLMCDFSHVHKYIEEKMGRPVWTHEMRASNRSFHEELTKRVKPDFIKLCGNETTPRPATEQEINDGKAKWCEVCIVDCPDKGKDLLCICEKGIAEGEVKS